jgi:acyl carrier protein
MPAAARGVNPPSESEDPVTDTTPLPLTAEKLASWLVDCVAAYTNLAADEIDRTVPLANYGLDSVAALSLCGDIEDEFDLVVKPTVAWDHPTVEALAAYLLDELGPKSASGS